MKQTVYEILGGFAISILIVFLVWVVLVTDNVPKEQEPEEMSSIDSVLTIETQYIIIRG